LNYSGPPDPVILQNNIKKLQSEVSTLRNSKAALEEELNHLRQGNATAQQLIKSKPSSTSNSVSHFSALNTEVNNNANVQQNLNNCKNSHTHQEPNDSGNRNFNHSNQDAADELGSQRLLEKVQNLEVEILLQRRDHHDRINELQAENDFLRRKVSGSSFIAHFGSN
jgi:cell division protein FtsB